MVIAIDYDGTFSADPELWAVFIAYARLRGHEVICVTGRSDEDQWGDQVRQALEGSGLLDVPIVFAAQDWKQDAARRAGWEVGVWIDDHPEAVAKQTLVK